LFGWICRHPVPLQSKGLSAVIISEMGQRVSRDTRRSASRRGCPDRRRPVAAGPRWPRCRSAVLPGETQERGSLNRAETTLLERCRRLGSP